MRFVRVLAASVMMSLLLAGPALAGSLNDVSVTVTDSPDPVVAGSNLTYTITVQNAGPTTAPDVTMNDFLQPEVTFVSLLAPAGWTVTTPPVGSSGTVSGNILNLTVAAGAQVFTLVVQVTPGTPNGTVLNNTATLVISPLFSDPNGLNNVSVTDTTVTAPAPPLPNAAMPEPAPGNPLAILGFAFLLVAALSATAVLATRRVRP